MTRARRYAAVLLSVILAVAAAPALGQTATVTIRLEGALRAADLVSLREPEGSPGPTKDRFDLFRKVMWGEGYHGEAEIAAFEDNNLFTFAVGVLSPGFPPRHAPSRSRPERPSGPGASYC